MTRKSQDAGPLGGDKRTLQPGHQEPGLFLGTDATDPSWVPGRGGDRGSRALKASPLKPEQGLGSSKSFLPTSHLEALQGLFQSPYY